MLTARYSKASAPQTIDLHCGSRLQECSLLYINFLAGSAVLSADDCKREGLCSAHAAGTSMRVDLVHRC